MALGEEKRKKGEKKEREEKKKKFYFGEQINTPTELHGEIVQLSSGEQFQSMHSNCINNIKSHTV